MGHLNVGFYVAKSMEALVGLVAELGMPRAFAADTQSTVLVREQHIRFMKEARPGAALSITGGVLSFGVADARLLLLMRHIGGEIAAAFQTTVAHVTAGDGREFPWPARMLASAQAMTIDVPPEAAPRSIGLDAVATQASLARAERFGLQRIGLGAVRPADCDVFGRMRTEMMMARISDGVPHLFNGQRLGAGEGVARVGGAALEYRLIHLAWPRAGDRLELRSGIAGGDARFRKLVHWLLDPATGTPWGVAENIAVAFDLDTRKIISLSEAGLARANAQVVAGLTL